MMTMQRLGLGGALALALACAPPVQAETTAQAMPETMAMLRHAIATRTVAGKDQVPVLARYLAGKLEAAGFPESDITIIPVEHTAALVVHYPGRDASLKPILLSGHMDVVAATNPAVWRDHDPFKLTKKDDYYYARGVADMKTNVIALVETFMRFKREGFVPKRGMILVLSGDEETDMASTRELAKRYHHAEFLLNADAGGGVLDAQRKPVVFRVQAAEKSYVDYLLTVTSPGGHSSEPDAAQNAIYRLARALEAIAAYRFPVRHNAITLASLKATGEHTSGPIADAMRQFAAHPDDAQAAAVIAADPAWAGQIRTTCIATMLQGGDARNALPKHVTANINCRIFPGVTVAAVQRQLAHAIADPEVAISVRPPPPLESPVSPLRPHVMGAVAATIHERYPGLEIVPAMSSGATDSMYFRKAGVPSYGVDPAFAIPGSAHAHGRNERLLASEIPAALDYWHSLLTRLTK